MLDKIIATGEQQIQNKLYSRFPAPLYTLSTHWKQNKTPFYSILTDLWGHKEAKPSIKMLRGL